MLERDVIRKTHALIKNLPIERVRMTMMQGASAGWPDYLYMLPNGQSIWIEYKRPGGKPTALQKHRLALLEELGHACAVADDPVEAARLITEAFKAAKAHRVR